MQAESVQGTSFAMFIKLNIHTAYSCNRHAKETEILSDT